MIIFKRLYAQPKEGEWTNAIIIYHNIPNIFYKPEKGFQEPVQVGGYKCGLRIDLWLAVLEFRWDKITKDYQKYLEHQAIKAVEEKE